jgi:hypothetical protein
MPSTYATMILARPARHVLQVTLARPEAANALCTPMGRNLLRRLSAAILLACGLTHAADEPSAVQLKPSIGLYQFSSRELPNKQAADVNLRASSDWGNAWVGVYRSPADELTQARLGWDNTYEKFGLKFQPSLQTASGGFWGGSLGTEYGDTFFVGAGIGRTNLRNYFNLNFDPNDAWSLSTGYRWSPQNYMLLQLVRDIRLNPDQQHVHLIYRRPFTGKQRLIVDLIFKSGTSEGEYIRRRGLMLGYDWGDIGLRIAYDPRVNFSHYDMTRIVLSKRY